MYPLLIRDLLIQRSATSALAAFSCTSPDDTSNMSPSFLSQNSTGVTNPSRTRVSVNGSSRVICHTSFLPRAVTLFAIVFASTGIVLARSDHAALIEAFAFAVSHLTSDNADESVFCVADHAIFVRFLSADEYIP